jgi:ABC-type thiamin/hydroxymethylpyrimidine transport system permease subunit
VKLAFLKYLFKCKSSCLLQKDSYPTSLEVFLFFFFFFGGYLSARLNFCLVLLFYVEVSISDYLFQAFLGYHAWIAII